MSNPQIPRSRLARRLAVTLLLPFAAISYRADAQAGSVPLSERVAVPEFVKEDWWNWIGRPTVTAPELLQPTLDPALPEYVPRRDIELAGFLKATPTNVTTSIFRAWIAQFRRYHPKVIIEMTPPYTGAEGKDGLIAGKIDFAIQSRELNPAFVKKFRKKFGYAPFCIPISLGSWRQSGYLDAVVIIVNGHNPLDRITFEQFDSIFSKAHLNSPPGKRISTWGELGVTGEWADKPIHAYGMTPWNGFEEFIRERILSRGADRGEWGENVKLMDNMMPQAPAVANDLYGIGYASLAWLNPKVKVLAVSQESQGPYYYPGYEDVALAEYPLTRYFYLVLNKPPGRPIENPIVREFLRFVLSRQGQQVTVDNRVYLPLRAVDAAKSRVMMDQTD